MIQALLDYLLKPSNHHQLLQHYHHHQQTILFLKESIFL